MERLGDRVSKYKNGKTRLKKRAFTVCGKRVWVYGHSKKELDEKEFKKRTEIEAGIYTSDKNLTLDKYFEEWLAGKRGSIKGATVSWYRTYYREHISPNLGNVKVQKIERRQVQAFQKELSEDLSITARNNIVKILKTMLKDAVTNGIIARNPAEGIKALKDTDAKAAETYHRALTEEEQEDFMREMADDYNYELIALLLCTGMRFGEAAALTWSDIDYKLNVIHVTKTSTFGEDGKKTTGTPKSEAGKRDIPMNGTIRDILAKQKRKLGAIIPIDQTEHRVFLSVYGKVLDNCTVNRAIRAALGRLEEKGKPMEHFTAHALRDTFATRYIEQGGNPQTLKTILGHNSLAMTMDLYSHVLPNTKQKEMDNLRITV